MFTPQTSAQNSNKYTVPKDVFKIQTGAQHQNKCISSKQMQIHTNKCTATKEILSPEICSQHPDKLLLLLKIYTADQGFSLNSLVFTI